jgi:hypothetical protein
MVNHYINKFCIRLKIIKIFKKKYIIRSPKIFQYKNHVEQLELII